MIKAGKIIFFGLGLLSIGSFFLGAKFPIFATFNHTKWGSWVDTSTCSTNTCGTTLGTKTQSRSCVSGGYGYECTLAHQECDQDCPTVTWSTSRRIVVTEGHFGNCPDGYTIDPQHENKCKKYFPEVRAVRYADKKWGWCPSKDSDYKSTDSSKQCSRNVVITEAYTDVKNRPWIEATYRTETFGPISFKYNKSNDPNKCHRPTGSSLGVPPWAMNDFNGDNNEWKQTVETNCHQVPSERQTRTIECHNAPETACVTGTPYPTTEPTAVPTENPGITPTPTLTNENTPTPTMTTEGTPVPTATEAPQVGGGDNGGTSNSNSNPPECTDADPGVPGNLRATALGGGKVRLDWNAAPGPHTSYAVAYGPTIGNYLYGDPNVGNVTTYTVSALTPGGKYCFYVQAQNGCRGGSPSNVVCSGQAVGGLNILGATDNYNPLVDGIKQSYGGQILGEATELAGTAEVTYSDDKLPSGNTLDIDHSIAIPVIGLKQAVYLPQMIGDEMVVGHHEVLSTTLEGSQLYYGHNATDVFGSLYKVNMGDKVVVSKHGTDQVYKVIEKELVSKNDVAAVKSENGQIVLMTCSYTQPDKRILVKASLIN